MSDEVSRLTEPLKGRCDIQRAEANAIGQYDMSRDASRMLATRFVPSPIELVIIPDFKSDLRQKLH